MIDSTVAEYRDISQIEFTDAIIGHRPIPLKQHTCSFYTFVQPTALSFSSQYIATTTKNDEHGFRRALIALNELMDGWNGFSAPAPNRATIVSAQELFEYLSDKVIPVANVGPCTTGGVGLTIIAGKIEYAVEFRNSGRIVITEIFEDDTFIFHDLTGIHRPNEAISAILKLGVL